MLTFSILFENIPPTDPNTLVNGAMQQLDQSNKEVEAAAVQKTNAEQKGMAAQNSAGIG